MAYFSLEFLIGRLLFDAAGNLGLIDTCARPWPSEGIDLDHLRTLEPDAALGNGGLGRLAACFMESMATLAIPAFGYGIRYDHGLFRQSITDGWQQELPEDWLSSGNPWEFQRPELTYRIGFGGSVTGAVEAGRMAFTWNPAETLFAVAFDTPMIGYGGKHANTLRLWSARAVDPLLLDAFNRGDHVGALTDRVRAEAVSRVLYPGDDSPAGQELRLRQEYFFASASLQDMLRRHLVEHDTITNLDELRRHPAERHPPGHRHCRADAPAAGRARAGVGAGLGHHPGPASATPTTPCCRRRWRCGRCCCWNGCCPAICRSSTC